MTAVVIKVAVLLAALGLVAGHSEYLPHFLRLIKEKSHIQRKFDTQYLHPLGEKAYFPNVSTITNGGTNAEAYWSFDNKRLTFQAQLAPYNETHPCDLIYNMNADGTDIKLISPAEGRDTCSYFFPDGEKLVYSSTMSGGPWCPAPPDQDFGYVWPLNKDMDIYIQDLSDPSKRVRVNPDNTGYHAESTISPNGKKLVYTSDQDGDLELYQMNLNGTAVERLTMTPGYDGGAYYSYDSNMITWRASRPQGENLTAYLELLNLGYVEPLHLDIFVMNLTGRTAKVPVRLTTNNAASFAPFFLPDGSGVIFASNLHDPEGGDFQLYIVDIDGKNLRQVTTEGSFNSFPMFSFDGKYLAWCSNRDVPPGDFETINVVVAEWKGKDFGEIKVVGKL